jgi:hypothetical protein
MKPYVPSGKSDEGSALVLIGAALLAGLAMGGLVNVIGQFIRLLLVFPAGMGLGVGLVASRICAARRIRAPGLVFFAALAGGLLSWCTDFGLDYLRARHGIRVQIEEVVAGLQDQQGILDGTIERCVDLTLVRWGRGQEMGTIDVAVNAYGETFTAEDGVTYAPEEVKGFLPPLVGYTQHLAAQGMTISNHGGKGSNIGAIGAVAVWVLDLLVATLVAAFIGREQARQPFCERCGAWYDKKETLLPVAPAGASKAVIEALQRGDVEALARARAPIDPRKAFVALSIRACAKCTSAPRFVSVAAIHTAGHKTTRKDGVRGLVEASVAESLVKVLAEPAKG